MPPEVPKEIADSLRRRFRLDEPVYMQYLAWLSRLLVGDFGISFFTNRPVAEELFGALGNTLVLALPAAVLGFLLGVLLGALAAYNHNTWLDKLFSATAIVGVSLPHYWVGIVLVAIFAVVLNVLPAQGMGFEGIPTSWEHVKHLILPVVTLSLIPMGVISRSDFNADAAIWNLDRYFKKDAKQFDPPGGAVAQARNPFVASYRKIDDSTIEITNPRPLSYFPNMLPYMLYSSPAQFEKQAPGPSSPSRRRARDPSRSRSSSHASA